jgi:hypothetical protein
MINPQGSFPAEPSRLSSLRFADIQVAITLKGSAGERNREAS